MDADLKISIRETLTLDNKTLVRASSCMYMFRNRILRDEKYFELQKYGTLNIFASKKPFPILENINIATYFTTQLCYRQLIREDYLLPIKSGLR